MREAERGGSPFAGFFPHPASVILVFARAPVPGRCKTRLAARHGARGAARIHRQLTRRSLATACAVGGARVELWCEPHARHAFFAEARRHFGVALRRQPAGDLGRKMALALADALRRAPAALILGTDAAALAPNDLRTALRALDSGRDCVLQPAEDGGYVLIGARRIAAGALRGIDWSSGRELAQTRARLARAGLTWTELPTLWDVDRPADVTRARRAGLL